MSSVSKVMELAPQSQFPIASTLPDTVVKPGIAGDFAHRVIFLHIPKTAGMSLHGLFIRNYRGDAIYNVGVRDISATEWKSAIERIEGLPREELSQYRVFKGHLIFGIHKHLPGPLEYVTFLRNPVDRIVSHYKMVHALGAFPPEHRLDPEQPLWNLGTYPDLHRSFDNYQVRAISGVDFDVPFGGITGEHVALAKANLEHHFAFVGLTEQFDLSLVLLQRLCGWGWRYYIPDNIARASTTVVTPEVRERLTELNRHDFELYHHVRERFDQLVATFGSGLRADYHAFRLGNRLHRGIHHLRHQMKKSLGLKGGDSCGQN